MLNTVELLRKARNTNEIMDVVEKIKKLTDKSGIVAKNLKSVLSSEISIDHTDKKAGKIEIVKFSMPNAKQIKKNSDLVKELYENANHLETASAMIKNSFASQKGAKEALKAIDALKTEVEKNVIIAFAALNSLAEKHQPRELEKLVSQLAQYLGRNLEDTSFEKISREVYVTLEGEKIHFCNYVNIEGLKDSKGFAAENYFVVLTSEMAVDGSSADLYLTSVHDFKPPGTYDLGRKVSDLKGAQIELQKLLAHDSIHSLFDQKPLEIEDSSKFTMVKGIVDASVENDVLTCLVDSNVKDVNKVVVEVLLLLQAVVGKKNKIRHKVIVKGKKTKIEFILTSNIVDKDKGVNISKLDNLKDMLELTDTEIKAIKRALRDRQN
jgi:hypothetical protein